MKQSIFQYVLGRLSVLDDEDLKKVDLESARSLIKESDISEEDKKSLEKLFSSIQDYSGIYHHGATVGQVNVVKGAGYASKALNIVGNLAIGSEMVQRYRYGRDYWK